MNWRLKAALQRACDLIPVGKQKVYRQLQLHCGGLVREYDHRFLLSETARMLSMLREVGFTVEGAVVMEVGTGWRLDMPIALYLCGAEKVITFDINRYLVSSLTLDSVRYIVNNAEKIRDIFNGIESSRFEQRIARLRRVRTIDDLFREAQIEYHAPCDCARTNLSDHSIDLHYSYTVLEHIAAPALVSILQEANRLLSPRGFAFHHIDLGDHFAQVDPAITTANFLQFSETAWRRYAGTPWSYHNRLREYEYRELFDRVPQEVVSWKPYVDSRSLETLKSGFSLAPQYRDQSPEVLSVSILDVISRPPSSQL